ncbi:AGE family epimerase/isomerase [Prosthecomicrobium sp. N25]|uniref:AGE family epimerase/isomerase n=1 Tax=Prosthecomicrobium sp. N25 TaxID=3129254 RepID=UPI0030770361
MSALDEAAGRARRWLVGEAAPLWWANGRDPAGGFVERIGLDGVALRERRRARVSARQVYAFAVAARLGWDGPVAAALRHGLDFLQGPAARSDGGIVATVAPDGTIPDAGPDLYDQAFWLLALAEARASLDDPALEDAGLRVLDLMEARMRHPVAGYEERDRRVLPLRANPHMHLLEAAAAWVPRGRSPRWRALGAEMAGMALRFFRDPATGALLEFFDGDWRPLPGAAGDVVEPGHLYEWTWLLWRWQTLTGEDVRPVALRFAEIARQHGLDPSRGVAIDEIGRDLAPRRRTARLWPQTERLKAGLALRAWGPPGSDLARIGEAEALAAWEALERYLDVPVRGLWRDRLDEDGRFAEEPAPASSFYHLACAIGELAGAVA